MTGSRVSVNKKGLGRFHISGKTVTIQDRWLSVNELMIYLGVSRDTIYDWLASRRLPGHRVGRLWKFKQDEIDGWVKAGNAASPVTFPNRTKTKAGPAKDANPKIQNKGSRHEADF